MNITHTYGGFYTAEKIRGNIVAGKQTSPRPGDLILVMEVEGWPKIFSELRSLGLDAVRAGGVNLRVIKP